MNGKSREVKRNAEMMSRRNDKPGIRSTMVRSACLLFMALFIVAWGAGAFSAEPGSPGSSKDKEGQTAGKSDSREFKKYRAVFSELTCGDAKALAVRIRPEQDSFPLLQAIDQRIYFINKTGRIKLVKDSWDYELKRNRINSSGYIYPAVSWDCTRDKRGKPYIIIFSWSGGNYPGAEWTEIYDLDGRLVASNYSEKIKNFRRNNDLFDKKIEKLGIHYDWRSSKEIGFEEQDGR
jgi:hypothetical protein